MIALRDDVRERVEAELRWYAQAARELSAVQSEILVLLSPSTASYSYIGSREGTPSDPTASRATRLALLRSRAEHARRVCSGVGSWLASLRWDDRMLAILHWGLGGSEPCEIADAAHAAGIPCESEEEAAALIAHREQLLLDAGGYLGWCGA